jgi:hypothetical protein
VGLKWRGYTIIALTNGFFYNKNNNKAEAKHFELKFSLSEQHFENGSKYFFFTFRVQQKFFVPNSQ